MAIYIYPSQQITATNPSVGLNNDVAPASSTQIAGNDAGDLVPLSVNSAGALALPQGASTEAKQDVGNSTLASIDTKVSTAAKQDTGNASLASIDGKVATAAKQDTGNASLSSIDSKVATAAKQDTGNASLSSIDSKVATAAKQDTGNSSLSSIDSKLVNAVTDANNSSTTPLLAGATFTGSATDIRNYGTVSVLVASDVAAASGGFKFQFSNDGTNWDHAHNFDFIGGNLSYNISAEARYFRIQYVNGASPQTYFRLQTVLRPVYVSPSQYTVAQPVTDSQLTTITKGVIFGKSTAGGGSYEAVKVNPSGALTVEASVTSSTLPTGAATEATLSTRASETTLQAVKTAVENLDNAVSGNELQVDVVTSALPTGAATETTLQSIEADTTTLAGTVSAGKVLVDGSGVTQPVSAASLPLPTGAATETTLNALNQRLSGSLVPVRFDEIALTYVAAGNGVGEIQTAVFKLATVTVKTLTLSYDSSNRLSGVVAT